MDRVVKTFCVDIDGTLCGITKDHNYHLATPNQNMIGAVNALYDAGHYIKIFTARGMCSGMEYEELTREQLNAWGVKYHELIMNKPSADYYIDDKGYDVMEFINTYKRFIDV